MLSRLFVTAVALSGATVCFGQSSLFKVNLDTKSKGSPSGLADEAYKLYRDNLWNLTTSNRLHRKAKGLPEVPLILPAIVRFQKNGQIMPTGGRTRGVGITLDIDPTFNSSADPTLVDFMQKLYDAAKPTIESIFGEAAVSGTVKVVNADATIGDRHAVTGGYYLPNDGSGGREIRLPVYNLRETQAVALIHCILLAYLPEQSYTNDAYLEGLVRAATQKIVRLPAAIQAAGHPTLVQDDIEKVIEGAYEIGATYDWTNQKSLGGPKFIAPNLINLPVNQGTRGGLYLQRYQMAGTAFEKVIAQYPNFIKDMNGFLKLNPTVGSDPAVFASFASTAMSGGTIEGDSFANWARKQFILDTRLSVGTKLHSLITPSLSGADFGAFDIEACLFSTDAAGNESLLSGTGYPVYWDKSYNRILASSQSETLDIATSYGSVSPIFTDTNGGTPYRIAVDIPVQDRLIRQYIPVGAVSTPAMPVGQVNDFYGTVVGFSAPAGTSLIVRVQNGSDSFDAPVTDFAFGIKVAPVLVSQNFLGTRSLTVRVIRRETGGTETTLLTRVVNKGPGALGLQLGNDPVISTGINGGVTRGVQLLGFTGDPLASDLETIFSSSNILAARYNPSKTNYDLYPNSGAVLGGQGYFLRIPLGASNLNPVWPARVESGTAVSVALRPGWNMITCPLGTGATFANVDVVHTLEFPRTYLGASGNDVNDTSTPLLGKNVFQFVPGAVDPVSGVSEGGSYVPATTFEAGKGYFVRCLAPEGAVMLFKPSSAQMASAGKSLPISHLLEVRVGRTGESSYALLGQAAGATVGFDAKFDSNLPPSFGGLQVAVSNIDQRFMDVRSPSASVTYRVNASGCVVGQKYTFNFLTKNGRATQIQVKDIQTGKVQTFGTVAGTLGFVASKTTMAFDVTVRGAR